MADFASQIVSHIKGKFNSPEFKTEVVEEVNDEAIRLTKRNTREGKGLADNEFQQYAPSTTQKKGRSSPVTFRDSGTTLANMYGEASESRGEITFNHNADVMYYHQKGQGRNPKREIFPVQEVDTQTMEELKDFAAEMIRRFLNES